MRPPKAPLTAGAVLSNSDGSQFVLPESQVSADNALKVTGAASASADLHDRTARPRNLPARSRGATGVRGLVDRRANANSSSPSPSLRTPSVVRHRWRGRWVPGGTTTPVTPVITPGAMTRGSEGMGSSAIGDGKWIEFVCGRGRGRRAPRKGRFRVTTVTPLVIKNSANGAPASLDDNQVSVNGCCVRYWLIIGSASI